VARVQVTGLGVVSPHGDDLDAMFGALWRGESAVREVFTELSLPKPAAAATVAFDESRWFTKLQLAGVDRVSQMAVAAADLATKHAGLPRPEGDARVRTGVFVGCGMGGATALDAAYQAGAKGGRVPPLTIPAFMPNAPAAHVGMRNGVLGPVLSYSVACASGAVAISEAAKAIRAGEIDVAIAGGSEALIVPGVVLAWQAMQTLAAFEPGVAGSAARCCKPFAADRSGFVLGEGAAFMVLESEAHARGRGARAVAELAGSGLSNDATHLTKPDAPGQQRALAAALAQAGLAPRDVGYCNAHGTATKVGDPIEAEALRAIWGRDIDGLLVSSTKALHGHLLGATGALEAVIAVLALQHGHVPPNAHLEHPDPAIGLNLVRDGGHRASALRAVLSNSFAFGGTNSVLLFTR
jgi:3-oxoacyl-[acyl-carrier-protein] synthase II